MKEDMRITKGISEDEMIAVFLKGEIGSFRFGEKIIKYLELDNQNRKIIDNPNIDNNEENKYRRNLFEKYRGYGSNKELFENFPQDVAWKRAILEKADLQNIKYINYDYWVELSGGSRKVIDGARNVIGGVEIFKQSNKNFWETNEIIEKGRRLPDSILVAESESSPLVVLEGHVRLTAYLMKSERITNELPVIIGFSQNMRKWDLY